MKLHQNERFGEIPSTKKYQRFLQCILQNILVKYREGLPNKLNTNLKGPFKVLKYSCPTYKLENFVARKHENYHVTDYANRDYFATVMDSNISHEPVKENFKKQIVSELKFQVRWKDLPAEFDRIIPWKELCRE